MKKLKYIVPLFCAISLLFASCGNGGNEGDQTPTYDTTSSPVPDNNSATNPSAADTAVSHPDSAKARDSTAH